MLLEGIETLLILSKHKTMSRTGSQLYISASAVSKRIANLERKLGKRLIEPDGRQVRLTADAVALIENIGPSFNELQGLIFDQQTLPDSTPLRIDCSETLVAGFLSDVFSRHLHQDPHLNITTNHTPRIVENVQSGQATLGICAGHIPSHHGLKAIHLTDEPFYTISKQPLTQLPACVITNDLNNPANSYQRLVLNQLGIAPLMEMDSYSAAAQLALAGVAPAIVPLSMVNTLKISRQYCFQFEELRGLYRPLHICLRPHSYKNPRVRSLITAIDDAVPKAISAPWPST